MLHAPESQSSEPYGGMVNTDVGDPGQLRILGRTSSVYARTQLSDEVVLR